MKKIITCAAIAALFLTACKNKSATTAPTGDSTAMMLERNKQAALNSDIAYIKGDFNESFKDYAKDFIEYGNGAQKPMKNIDSMKMDGKQLLIGFPDFKVEDLHAVASGDTVIVTGVWSGTFKKDYRKMKATNKSFKMPDADIFVFNKDGKIASHANVQSYLYALYQLDVPMPPKKK
ncbi:MAG: hypothetical protein JWR50_2162 [Mucilaginibacter sp.]|nr:hypothetical protein [Mucilaginibacter sp.]